MSFKRIVISALLVCSMATAFAQGGIYRKKYEELVNVDGHNRMSGFHFAPGLTWSFAPAKNKELGLMRAGDTVTNGVLDGKGQLGFYLEAGMYHLFKYGRFFRYLDWSVAFKQLRGAQKFTNTTSIESLSTTIATGEGENAFRYNFLLANVNLNNIWQIGNYSFIQNAIGLNFDYALGKSETANGLVSPSTFNKMIFALHYKLGYGFKVNQKLFIIPSLETPILNFIPFEKGRSTIGVFDLRYRPVILSVRIAWLRRPKPNACPPLPGTEGDKKRQEQYQMQGR